MDKFFNRVIIVLFFMVTLLTLLSPKTVLADEEPEDRTIYCPLCEHRNDDDPFYNKERQFYQKIHLIKQVFGDSIDEVVLAAAVIRRYDNKELAYEREYDENFDSNQYKDTWRKAEKTDNYSIFGDSNKVDMTQDDKNRVEANEKLDLITTAAIVMIDSNHMGQYSDVCYRDALAGNGLVGNNDNNLPFVTFYNAVVCGFDESIAVVTTPLQFIMDWFSGDNFFVSAESARRKLVNIKKVCENGYIGGLYDGVAEIEDEGIRAETKKMYAQQIIDFANYYKTLYSIYEEGETCNSNTAGSTGAFATWKQYDPKWKDIELGHSGSTVGSIGCLLTSMAMQISRSGTSFGTFPSGENEFNPGTLAKSMNENNGFDGSGNFIYSGTSTIAPKWHTNGYQSINVSDNKKLAQIISDELSKDINGKQKYIILCLHHRASSQHWVAVDGVSDEVVKIFDPVATGNDLDSNYNDWVVEGYVVCYADDVDFGKEGTNNGNGCSGGGNDLNRLIGFLAYNEGHEMCNFQGRGENTGYGAGTLAGDAGGQTTAFGITIYDEDIANKIGYTSFAQELYSGCTEKESTEKLLIATIDYLANDWTQKQIDQHGLTVTENEKYMLMSVNYGGITLAVPIMQAMKTYGKDSEQVFEAFKTSFGIDYAIRNGFHGLMRRRLTEYEIFMTGNYEAESSNYLQMPYIQNGLAMSKSEVMSHWPTKRDELLEGMPFAPIDGTSVGGSSGTGELVCKNGNAVRDNG